MNIEYCPPAITHVKPLEGRTVELRYETGLIGKVDLAPLIASGPIWSRVRSDDDFFRKVQIDAFGSLCWPDESDIAPEHLYGAITAPAAVSA
ncbi:MAG: DUF2442 domain-containing protein [Cellulomonadaceae bacterium]|nr:DUF2442 domain-containing protein [Cellulomonadaceae bacterium]